LSVNEVRNNRGLEELIESDQEEKEEPEK